MRLFRLIDPERGRAILSPCCAAYSGSPEAAATFGKIDHPLGDLGETGSHHVDQRDSLAQQRNLRFSEGTCLAKVHRRALRPQAGSSADAQDRCRGLPPGPQEAYHSPLQERCTREDLVGRD